MVESILKIRKYFFKTFYKMFLIEINFLSLNVIAIRITGRFPTFIPEHTIYAVLYFVFKILSESIFPITV